MQPPAFDIPDDIGAAWYLAHCGIRIAAAWAGTHLDARSEHRILNLGWSRATGSFLGRPARGVSAGVRMADLALVLSVDGELRRGTPLGGREPQALLEWMRTEGNDLGARDAPLSLPNYFERPPHLILNAPLPDVSADASTRVGAHTARAAAILRDLAQEHDGSSEVRCWVRDFDITLTLPGTGERTLEVAYQAGVDDGPRWCIWVDEDVEPPTLSDGEWVAGERHGAVLYESTLPAFGGERVVRDWLASLIRPLSHYV